MRRPRILVRAVALVACSGLAALGLSVASPSVAADPITGRIIDSTGSHPPVDGATVRLRELAPGGGPGTVVDTTTTSSTGTFALDAGTSAAEEFFVQVLPGRYQGGWVGGDPAYVMRNLGDAATYGRGVAIGTIGALPAFIRGVAVDSATGRPVRGVRVTARSATDMTEVEGSDETGRDGVFRIGGLTCEDDCYLKLNGAPHHEVGFRACDATVVPTWGAACGSPIGRIGKVRLDAS